MMKAFQMLEKVMRREDAVSRLAIQNLLKLVIPFNIPHGFHLRTLSAEEVRIDLPNNKFNHNHLGGMHACAIATLGEFCAGLTLARHLGLSRYRFILAELQVKYHMQGRTKLTGVAQLNEERAEEIRQRLLTEDQLLFEHHTEITNVHGEKVAEVRSVWQVKDWQKVRLK